jgi:UDP-N-acetylmuramate dehydrogenase
MRDFADFRGTLRREYPLADHTTWRVGGCAQRFVVPADLEDLLALLQVVREVDEPCYVLGRGSNVLIGDDGLPGVTLQLGKAFNYIRREENTLRVGGAMPLPGLAQRAASAGFRGFEYFMGIPGTVGAGVTINAGKGTQTGQDIRSVLKSARVVTRKLEVITMTADDLQLSYRDSLLKSQGGLVIEAVFKPTCIAEPAEIVGDIRAGLAERRVKFPLNYPNAGSVFRRPKDGNPAGWYIENAGLKGLRIGDAMVSTQHANFIVNLGKAKAADIRALMDMVREKVLQVFGVVLEKEVVFMPEERNW